MSSPNLFTPSEPGVGVEEPPTELIATPQPGQPHRSRAVGIGAALVGLLLVAGAAVALLLPGAAPAPAADPDGVSDIGELTDGTTVDGAPPTSAAGQPAGDPTVGLGDDTLLIGRLAANGNGALVVAQDGGPERTVRVDGRTAVRGGNRAVADLRAGERVLVRVEGTGAAAVAVSVTVPRARATGTVTAVAGSTVTLMQPDGRTVPVDVTKVEPKPVVGAVVVLVGTGTDGAGFTADRIRVLPSLS